MRTFHKLSPKDLDQYMPIYLEAYPAYKTLDQEGRDYYRQRISTDMTQDTDVDFIGLFEENRLIALMKIVHFSMNIFGKMDKAFGLMSLAVDPLYKKQKAAFQMVQYFESYAKNQGVNILALLPFSIGFYRKMGYGLGGKLGHYHLPTSNLPKTTDLSSLERIPFQDRPHMIEAYKKMAHKTHGMFEKFDEEKRALLEDRESFAIGYYKEDQLSSYASYHYESTHANNYTQTKIVVDEMVYQNPQELRKLLGYFAQQADLAQSIVISHPESDFYHLFEDPQDLSLNSIPFGYLQTNTSFVANMYKILDIKEFIRQCSHRSFAPISLVLSLKAFNEISKEWEEVTIEFVPDPEKSRSTWQLSHKKPQVTLRANKGDICALLLNAISLSSLVSLSIGHLDKEEYMHQLDWLFYYHQRPYSNNDY